MKCPIRWCLAVAIGGRLLACNTVEGDRIRGAEFAAADPAFSALDSALDLGPAPLAGARRIFRAPELALLAARYGIAETPPEICFERAALKLSADRLLPALQAALSSPDVEILDFSKYPVPLGNFEFTRAGLAPSGFWRGRVLYGENRSAAVWVKIRVADSSGSRVERGDAVRVEVRSGGVLLAFAASAESAGRVGEPVIVRNPQNGRRFQARVDGKGKVSVQK
jgi:hypothetical protein